MHGGSSLAEWYLGLQGQGLGESVDGYFTTLGGTILNPEREVSGLGLGGLQEVVFNGRLRGGAVRGGGRRSLILESGSAHSVVLLTVGTLACRAIGVGPSGIGNLAVQVMEVSLVVRVGRMGFRGEWLVRGLVEVGFFSGREGWGLLWEGCVGSAQLVVIRRTYRKVSPRSGRVVVLRVGGRMRVFQELVLVGLGLRKGCREWWC